MRKEIENQEKVVIGWKEFASLEEWGIENLRVKIDSGARTSAIHVSKIEELEDGQIKFEVVIQEKPDRKTVWVTSMPVRTTIVKPSSGQKQKRYVCSTKLKMGPITRDIEISLVSRKGMLSRMLVGRTALEKAYLIDSGKKYLLSPKKSKKRKENLI